MAPTAIPSDAPDVTQEVLGGGGLGFAQAARLFPPFREGRPVHPSTLWRWHAVGVSLPGGRVVRLEAVRLGGRHLTSRAAVERFIRAQQEAGTNIVPAARTAQQRRRGNGDAAAQLERLGI
jgi:hypothetical protein